MAKAPRSLVLGTAGHIDHGKTTLVRALTGVDTDRLPEEKRRGITIELGFAAWEISDDLRASIVDVPGHEGFVRTMVAGAGGIDLVILVVSAEDGVMPQTREHINVCRLLGIEHGVVALTKVDRLEGDAEAIELAAEDVRTALAGSVFEPARIIPCSAHTGEGLPELRAEVRRLATKIPRRDSQGPVILPIDRVFTIKGHGTVVTGTLLSGVVDLTADNHLRLCPAGEGRVERDVRSRGAQVRSADQARVMAGNRLALNLANVEVSELHRGDVLTRGPAVQATTVVHAMMQHLPGRDPPWGHDTSVQLCAGTAHAPARLDPLWHAPSPELPYEGTEAEPTIPPGHEGLVRIRLEQPLPLWRDQRLVLRGFSSSTTAGAHDDQGLTLGGGLVVDPEPSSGRGQRARWIAVGRALADPDPSTRIRALVHDAGVVGIDRTAVERRTGLRDAGPLLRSMSEGKGAVLVPLGNDRYVHTEMVRPLVDRLIAAVDRFHADNPMQPGIGRASTEALLGARVAPAVASWAVDQAIGRGALRAVDDQGTLARPGKGVPTEGELPEHMQRVLDQYEQAGLEAPNLKDVQAACGLSSRQILEIVGVLQRTGRLVKLTPEISWARASHDALVQEVREHLRGNGTIDVQALKQMTGLSRKYAVPFLELLDQLQITRRDGDRRMPGPRVDG
ncbi:selenocysteine-specific translation elongation factor [Paraliomyxa miuraensis]|uniref:selenocysteine-specific translation elongation factor n=1 Tax=Paraliomyxa miuraensis TaxID=376150 RepID=UPI00224CECC4|nr:selenocysteine-specific translation elongation factor [Paraliomyxa miuraensis]MCX4247391.1 selenocysteine-specific translation elongation factor [Paraliomyxa miuraensis]